MPSFTARCELHIPPTAFEHRIRTLRISTSGKHHSLLPASPSSGANQTNSESICADFLPSGIISVVYLLTELFLKAEAGGRLRSLVADVTAPQSHSAVYLEVISGVRPGPSTRTADAKSVI